jgi:hypothetical protein
LSEKPSLIERMKARWNAAESRFLTGVRRRVSLRRAGYAYLAALAIFVVYFMMFPNLYAITLVSSVFTIVAMYLIMVTSNLELQKSTQEQAKAFVTGLQRVENELHDIAGDLGRVAGTMGSVERILASQAGLQEKALAEQREATRERIERLKPRLFASLQLEGSSFLGLDWHSYHLYLRNEGATASELIVFAGPPNQSKPLGPLRMEYNQGQNFNIGFYKEITQAGVAQISVTCRDGEGRVYKGSETLAAGNPQWIGVTIAQTIP